MTEANQNPDPSNEAPTPEVQLVGSAQTDKIEAGALPEIVFPELPELSDNIFYERDGVQIELFMSFGLLNTLIQRIGTVENLGFVGVDASFNEVILKELLHERTPGGKVTKAVEDIGDVDVPISDVQEMLSWAQQHMMNFFIRALEKAGGLAQKHNKGTNQQSNLLRGLIGSLNLKS